MNSRQENKRKVWNLWQEINESPQSFRSAAERCMAPDLLWQGPHPMNTLRGREALASGFWEPFIAAFPDVRKDPYIFMAGEFEGGNWISSTGYFSGTFTNDWLDIPATDRTAHIRFGEFCKLQDGKIFEIYTILDIPDVMRQAGFDVLGPCLGEEGLAPGPKGEDGILLDDQDPAETRKSLVLVEAMLKGLSEYDGSGNLHTMGQERFWTPDMLWYGPHGIGTTYGLTGFQENHQRPFLEAFPDRQGGNHVCRHAEGLYVASTGWPSLRATHKGSYKGVAPTGNRIGMRVMDWWRRDGETLAENWVFIDMIDLYLQMGVDVFARMHSIING